MKTLMLLIGSHYLCDFALQSDWMAKAKNPFLNGNNVGLGGKRSWVWLHAMVAHCAIQALGVLLISNRWELAIAEFFCHLVIDLHKCQGSIGFTADQAAHIVCRLAWWMIILVR